MDRRRFDLKPKHRGGYTERHADHCERTLVTLLRGLGPWKQGVYLIGGLVPRYLIQPRPGMQIPPYVGTMDVDLVLDLKLLADVEAYRRLEQNLKALGFELDLTAELLDGRGVATERVRIAGIVPFLVLKALAYEERYEEKDANDLIYALMFYEAGPPDVAAVFAERLVRWPEETLLTQALQILRARFATDSQTPGARKHGPYSYARFQTEVGRSDLDARHRQDAASVIEQFLSEVEARRV